MHVTIRRQYRRVRNALEFAIKRPPSLDNMDYGLKAVHDQLLLSSEWLCRVDPDSGQAYLFKFAVLPDELGIIFLFSDTSSVWTETLTGHRLTRRARELDTEDVGSIMDSADEEAWINSKLDLLKMHFCPTGILQLDMTIGERTRFADFVVSFEAHDGEFSWRVEGEELNPKQATEVLSKHLLRPLIGLSSVLCEPDVQLKDNPETLEKAIDSTGRSAARKPGQFTRAFFGQPDTAGALRRFTEVSNGVKRPGPVTSSAPSPPLKRNATTGERTSSSASPTPRRPTFRDSAEPLAEPVPSRVYATSSPTPGARLEAATSHRRSPIDSSATEDSIDEPLSTPAPSPKFKTPSPPPQPEKREERQEVGNEAKRDKGKETKKRKEKEVTPEPPSSSSATMPSQSQMTPKKGKEALQAMLKRKPKARAPRSGF